MRAVTEFANFTLNQALKTQATLTTEGKTPEEVQAALGAAFKFEGEKLTHLIHAMDVATKNSENLRRVMVVSLNEGEAAPAKAVQIEAFHYVPDFLVTARPAAPAHSGKGGRPGGRGKGGGAPKGSPWGLTPEEKAAKGGNKAAKPS